VLHTHLEQKAVQLGHWQGIGPGQVEHAFGRRDDRIPGPHTQRGRRLGADHALSEQLRSARFPQSRLTGKANLLVMPNQDAANIAFNLLKQIGEGIAIGPILVGAAKSAHVVTPSITVRGLLNMTALAAVRAG
jgi:malate dehydrogenase (oxaloacetate-decarboxylating)(NADP+)